MQRWWETAWDAQKYKKWLTSEINVWDLTNHEMERQKKNFEKWSKNID